MQNETPSSYPEVAPYQVSDQKSENWADTDSTNFNTILRLAQLVLARCNICTPGGLGVSPVNSEAQFREFEPPRGKCFCFFLCSSRVWACYATTTTTTVEQQLYYYYCYYFTTILLLQKRRANPGYYNTVVAVHNYFRCVGDYMVVVPEGIPQGTWGFSERNPKCVCAYV